MSQGITHFAVGATVTILAAALVVPDVRYPRTWSIVGGGWAMVPDASKLYASGGTLSFHDSIWANAFWGHRLLDRLDPGDSTAWASVAVAALLGATMLAEFRSYRAVEPIRSGLEERGLVDGE